MERLKIFLKKIFFLPPLPTVLIAVPSFLFVFVILAAENHSVTAYAAYLLSAYAAVITVTGFSGIIEAVKNLWKKNPFIRKIRRHHLGKLLLDDAVFRSKITIHGSMAINLLYVVMNLFSGILYRSVWFLSLAVYYMLLSVMYALLVRYIRRKPLGEDLPAEYGCCRVCGILLLMMNQALAGIVIIMVKENRGFSYPGQLIYIMAFYVFYITVLAAVNVIKFRRRGSPVLSAAKIVSLTGALVSMLSLETAMISRFGADQPEFRQVMTSVFGGSVCTAVLAMAIFMIVRSGRRLRMLRSADRRNDREK